MVQSAIKIAQLHPSKMPVRSPPAPAPASSVPSAPVSALSLSVAVSAPSGHRWLLVGRSSIVFDAGVDMAAGGVAVDEVVLVVVVGVYIGNRCHSHGGRPWRLR